VLKHVDAAELRVVAATVLAVVTAAVRVAHHLTKLGAHLVTTLARLHVRNLARKFGTEYIKLRVKVRHGKQENPVARAHLSPTTEPSHSTNPTFGRRAKRAGWGRVRLCCCEKLFRPRGHCSSPSGSATMLSQQEMDNSADAQQDRSNITGFM
jgi:hypothetical protein